MSFTDNSRFLLMLIYSVKTNKYHSDMAVLFFAYDGQNYARNVNMIVLNDMHHRYTYIYVRICCASYH